MNKTIIWLVTIIIVAVGGYFILRGDEALAPLAETPAELPTETGETTTHTIVYTANGYSPGQLTIKVGDTVIFKNESQMEMWTASAMHPTHKVYPGSGIEKCGTAEAAKIFDACAAIASGGEWSFTFTEAGTWAYHNHLQSNHFGKVIVE